VEGEVDKIIVPESLGAFKTGSTFMHSGLSLQECVVPVVSIEVGGGLSLQECVVPVVSIEVGAVGKSAKKIDLQLQYRGAKKREHHHAAADHRGHSPTA
jgi:hypothetical protein